MIELISNQMKWVSGDNIKLANGSVAKMFLLISLSSISSLSCADTYPDYSLYGQRHAGQIWNTQGNLAFSQWANAPLDGSYNTNVSWGEPSAWPAKLTVENHTVKYNCSGGSAVVYLMSLGGYPITTTKAQYVDINTNTTYDITNNGTCGKNGHPYALVNVYNAPYIMRVWGTIGSTNGPNQHRFFWEAKYTNYQNTANPCRGGTTATTILQEETWWDRIMPSGPSSTNQASGWEAKWPTLRAGSGSMGVPDNGPYTGNYAYSEPTAKNVVYDNYQTIGKGYGFGWTIGGYSPDGKAKNTGCLKYDWAY